MNKTGSGSITDKAARTISVIFHPLLIPVYGMVIILTAPTLYNFIPFEVKKFIILIILVNNVLLPLSMIPFFVHRNMISSWSITDRKDRNIPLIMSTTLYIITTIILFRFPVPFFLKSYFFAVTFLSMSAMIINFWWKISLHSIGSGMLLALVLVLSFRMYTPLVWFLVPSAIAGGIIMASRLQLNLHNPGQVWTGYLAGFLGFYAVTLLF